jgi:hypothetical protein
MSIPHYSGALSLLSPQLLQAFTAQRRILMEKKQDLMNEILMELEPQELEPRLELQVLIDTLGTIADAANNVNCSAGGNCKVEN